MSNKTINMTDQLYQYMLDNSLREHSLLTELRERTKSMPESNMQISPEQGEFMALLIKLIGAKKCLEVGVFTGYSSLAVALALPENGKIIACDINEEFTDIAKEFWQKAKVQHKIDLHLAPASNTLQKLIEQGLSSEFDFAFIDADKESYPDYYEKSVQLIHNGGLIAIDNMFRNGDVADPNENSAVVLATRKLWEIIHHDDRIDASIVPIADGLMLVRKR